MTTTGLPQNRLLVMVFSRVALFIPVRLVVIFLPAGTLAFWEGWLYLTVLLGPALVILPWMLKNSPDLLANRMRMKEKARTQQWVVSILGVFMVAAYILPGFDFRWGW